MQPEDMTPAQLRKRIKALNADTPRYKALEAALGEGVGYGHAWYATQKEHWLGWLSEYSGAGAYGRKVGPKRSAQFVYNHIQCAPMLFWLSEALDVEDELLDDAFAAVLAAPARNASQCAALRRVISWQKVHAILVAQSPPTLVGKIRNAIL